MLLIVGFSHSCPQIYWLLPPTWYLVFFCHPWFSAFKYSSDFWNIYLHLHSPIDRPLINHQSPCYSAVDCWLIFIYDPWSLLGSHQHRPWYSSVIPDLLISKIPLIFEHFLALALINWYTPDRSSITMFFCCLLSIDLYFWLQINC